MHSNIHTCKINASLKNSDAGVASDADYCVAGGYSIRGRMRRKKWKDVDE